MISNDILLKYYFHYFNFSNFKELMRNKIFIKSLIFFPLILILINFFNLLFPNDYRNDPYLINGYFSEENQKILNYVSDKKRSEILSYEDAIKKID